MAAISERLGMDQSLKLSLPNWELKNREEGRRPRGAEELDALMGRLGRRHRLPLGPKGLDFLHVYEAPDKYIIFAVINGASLIFEDTLDLFPSDALVTQIRMSLP